MASTGPAVVIDAPPLTPPPNGLLSTAPVIEHDDPSDQRWINGLRFSPETCTAAVVFDPCATGIGDVYATVTDGVTNSTTTVTSASALFVINDVGRPISGSGIPAGATIVTVTNATTIVISAAATATASGVTLTFIGRNPGSVRPSPLFFRPFGIEAFDTCSAFGYEQADYEGRARRALVAHESAGLEHEFITGSIISANRHLQDGGSADTVTLASGAAQGLRTGLALLTQAAADNGLGKGAIHARPFLVTLWGSMQLLLTNNGKLTTHTGVPVIPGYGYTGAKPDGTAHTTTSEWVYITAFPQIHRGPVEVFASEADRAASLDRINNTVTVRAQRMYSVLYSCGQYAINIDPTSTS